MTDVHASTLLSEGCEKPFRGQGRSTVLIHACLCSLPLIDGPVNEVPRRSVGRSPFSSSGSQSRPIYSTYHDLSCHLLVNTHEGPTSSYYPSGVLACLLSMSDESGVNDAFSLLSATYHDHLYRLNRNLSQSLADFPVQRILDNSLRCLERAKNSKSLDEVKGDGNDLEQTQTSLRNLRDAVPYAQSVYRYVRDLEGTLGALTSLHIVLNERSRRNIQDLVGGLAHAVEDALPRYSTSTSDTATQEQWKRLSAAKTTDVENWARDYLSLAQSGEIYVHSSEGTMSLKGAQAVAQLDATRAQLLGPESAELAEWPSSTSRSMSAWSHPPELMRLVMSNEEHENSTRMVVVSAAALSLAATLLVDPSLSRSHQR